MTDDRDPLERLAELGSATEGIQPRSGFSMRVMDSILEQPVSFFGQLVGMSWRLLPVATAIALLAFGWAVQEDGALDEAMAASYDVVEVEW